MAESQKHLLVFLCHASMDKPKVEPLYHRLVMDGVDAWLDTEKLIPGQEWQKVIPKAVRKSHVVLVCLSTESVTREGYVQKEITIALDSADEKPEGTIFIIPVRLDDCQVPERLGRFHWVNLFSDGGYEQLLKALQHRANSLGIVFENKSTDIKTPIAKNLIAEPVKRPSYQIEFIQKIAREFGLTNKLLAQEIENIKNILSKIRKANLNSLQRRLFKIVIENDSGEGVYRRIVESEARFDYMSNEFFDEMMVLQHKELIYFDDEGQVFSVFGGYDTWELINAMLDGVNVDLESLIKDPSFNLLLPDSP